MCAVPSIAVFCSESIECFPGIVSKFFFKLLVTIPVAPIITGTIVHLRFHIRCISIHKLLYFNFFSASFCTTFLSAGTAITISVHVFSFLFLIIISGLFAVTYLSVCIAWFHNTVTSPSSHTGLGMCVYPLSVVSIPKALHIEYCRCVQTLSCLIKYSFFAKMGHPEVKWSIVSSCCLHNRHLLSGSLLLLLLSSSSSSSSLLFLTTSSTEQCKFNSTPLLY